MIDWWILAANSVWIVAAALALAVVGVGYYKSNMGDQKLSSILNQAKFALLLNIAGAIFCLGMALTSNRWWEITLWVVLMVGFGHQVIYIKKNNY